MDININDVLEMKKPHPCGRENSGKMKVLRVGMDFKLKCLGCGREIMTPRSKCEKKIKKIEKIKINTEEN